MVPEPSTAEATGRPSRESRATTALLFTGLFTLLIVPLYWRTISPVPAVALITLAGPVIGASVELVAAVGLAWRSAWASTAMTPVLQILALSGVVTFLASLVGGGINIPIGAILAIWALRAPPRRAPEPTASRSVGRLLAPILVATLAISAAWQFIVPATTQAGGPLIAAASDLHLELAATPCDDEAAVADDPPEAIDVVLRWSWARAEPVRAGTDAVVLSWATMGGPEGSGGFYLDTPSRQEPGITEEDRSRRFTIYRSDLGLRGFEPGSVKIRLRRPSELTSGPVYVQVAATYAHHYLGQVQATPQGVWTRAEEVSCAW